MAFEQRSEEKGVGALWIWKKIMAGRGVVRAKALGTKCAGVFWEQDGRHNGSGAIWWKNGREWTSPQ